MQPKNTIMSNKPKLVRAPLVEIEHLCVRPKGAHPVAIKIRFIVDYTSLSVTMQVLDMAESMRSMYAPFYFLCRSDLGHLRVICSDRPGIDLEKKAIYLRGADRLADDDTSRVTFGDAAQLDAFMLLAITALTRASHSAVSRKHFIAAAAKPIARPNASPAKLEARAAKVSASLDALNKLLGNSSDTAASTTPPTRVVLVSNKTKKAISAHHSLPPLSLSFPVRFGGLEYPFVAIRCQRCRVESPQEFTRGTVMRPTSQIALVSASIYCDRCNLLTPFVSALYADGRTETPRYGAWSVEDARRIAAEQALHVQSGVSA